MTTHQSPPGSPQEAGPRERFDLERFVAAQTPVYAQVLSELRAGRKMTHWMWYIFPQIRGLGSSATAQHYAIASLDEARAYLAHPVLGPRLMECTTLVLQHAGNLKDPARAPRSIIDDMFGYPDNLKFHSSMTLFAHAAANSPQQPSVFQHALQSFFAGQPDQATLARL